MSQQPPPRDPRTPFGAPTRDPRTPFGQQSLPPTKAEQFAPPPNRKPLWITLAALAVVALVIWGAIRVGGSEPEPEAAATPAASPSQEPTWPGDQATAPQATGTPQTGARTSVPFTNPGDDAAGTFSIVRHRWTDQGLLLTIKVELDSGSQRLGFFALDNGPTARQFDPSPSGEDYLDGRRISAGETLTGTILFEKPQGDTTVFLAGSTGRQVAALTVEG
ncbi:hypothetical protein [Luteococcus sp. OSA5]|uniref:hypothetical protein n=1 Tax=Luteococcus sp. OSA5 TaxID=3401630 RepID=UPI003B43C6B1